MMRSKESGLELLVWFILGYGIFTFTRTTTYIPLAIVIAPIFILHLLENQSTLKGIALSFLGFFIAIQLSVGSAFDFANPAFSFFLLFKNMILAFTLALPYWLTRVLQKKQTGFVDTFIFPLSTVALYFIASKIGYFDGVIIFYAYAQYGNLPFMQLLSLAGTWGLIFYLSWFSSLLCWVWRSSFKMQQIKEGLVIFTIVTVALFLYGGSRISPMTLNYSEPSVRIAAAVLPVDPKKDEMRVDRILNDRLFTPIANRVALIEPLVKEAALASAKIIVMQEMLMVVPQEEEQAVIDQMTRLARENNIYICFSYVAMPKLLPGEHDTFMGYTELDDELEEGKNLALLINNQGKVVTQYQKHKLVFGEGTWIKEGPADIPVVETPYGKIGVVICRDMEFSDYMRQAGQRDADIVLAPSYEAVKSLTISYAQMLRSIEHGFSFVRACQNGLSLAVDFKGQMLATMNSFTTSHNIMYAEVPSQGVDTIYTFFGDFFAWLSIFILCFVGFLTYKG